MSKAPKLDVLETDDIPLREVSGLALSGSRLLAVGDHQCSLFSAPLGPSPLRWEAIELADLDLPDGGSQFEAVLPVDDHTVLILQEQPARVLLVDLNVRALLGTLILYVPKGHPLRLGLHGADGASRRRHSFRPRHRGTGSE